MSAPKRSVFQLVDRYQARCLRTWPSNGQTDHQRLSHAGIGLSEEVGECLTLLKRHLFYGQPLDVDALRLELGDVAYYLSVLAREAGLTMSDVLSRNVEKLDKRYAKDWTAEEAAGRADEADEASKRPNVLANACDVCGKPVPLRSGPWCSEAHMRFGKMHCQSCGGLIGDDDVFDDGGCRFCGHDSGRRVKR